MQSPAHITAQRLGYGVVPGGWQEGRKYRRLHSGALAITASRDTAATWLQDGPSTLRANHFGAWGAFHIPFEAAAARRTPAHPARPPSFGLCCGLSSEPGLALGEACTNSSPRLPPGLLHCARPMAKPQRRGRLAWNKEAHGSAGPPRSARHFLDASIIIWPACVMWRGATRGRARRPGPARTATMALRPAEREMATLGPPPSRAQPRPTAASGLGQPRPRQGRRALPEGRRGLAQQTRAPAAVRWRGEEQGPQAPRGISNFYDSTNILSPLRKPAQRAGPKGQGWLGRAAGLGFCPVNRK